jgi:hypothetical protein
LPLTFLLVDQRQANFPSIDPATDELRTLAARAGNAVDSVVRIDDVRLRRAYEFRGRTGDIIP